MQRLNRTDAEKVRSDLDAMLERLKGRGYDFRATDKRYLEPCWRAIDGHLITAEVCEWIGDLSGSQAALDQVNRLLDQVLEEMPD